MAGNERDAESEPKPFGKGAEDGDLGGSTRAGRIRVLEGLIEDLEGSIRPTLERIRALRGIVEQERDALFLDERRAQRARERPTMDEQPAKPEQPLARGAAARASRPQYPSSGDGTKHLEASHS
jgi:hypothetical protein